jgi:hypothetical protein
MECISTATVEGMKVIGKTMSKRLKAGRFCSAVLFIQIIIGKERRIDLVNIIADVVYTRQLVENKINGKGKDLFVNFR